MPEINEELEIHDDRGARGEPEPGPEVYDDITQNAGKEEEFHHGDRWKFEGKTDKKGSVVVSVEESSTGHEDMDNDQSDLVPCDFFSVRETARHAGYLYGQAGEIARPFRLYTRSSNCSPTALLSINEDEQSRSRRERNICAMPQQSKLALDSSRAATYQLSCAELPPSLPLWLGAGGGSDPGTSPRKRPETFKIRKLSSFFQPMSSENISTVIFRPRPTFLRELNDRNWQEKMLCAVHSTQDEGHHSAQGDSQGRFYHRASDRRSEGTSCEFVVQFLPSIPRTFSDSKNFLARVPESFCLTLPQQDSEFEDGQVRCSTQVTPLSISSVGDSQFDNFGTEIVEVNEPSLSKGTYSRHRLEENDPTNESDILGKFKQEDLVLTLGVGKSEPATGGKSEGRCALDLLLSAIQVTSGSTSIEDVPGGPEVLESLIEANKDAHFESEDVFFLYGRSPIVKKRVIRRARNAFKKQHGRNALVNALKVRIPEYVPEINVGRRKRKTLPDDKHEGQQKDNISNSGVPEVVHLKEGDPLIRSKRGRYQVLPIKFSDSVLQPWKRTPRRGQKAKF